jgi:diacylglycerol O-acyltransferase / wax synthase
MVAGLTAWEHWPRPSDPLPAPEPTTGRSPVARRVLIVSADIGGGHHATGRALEERVLQLWPGSAVEWVDTLEAMGPGVGPAFRRTYVTNVELTPWLYEFFYASLWRHRWFAEASKRFVGAWAGRRLAPAVAAFDPDLILSTYPLGSAGLAWLRERRGLAAAVGAWISDFAPHPFWVYPQLDLNLVVHPGAVPTAAAAAPGSVIGVCPPPVVGRFHPGNTRRARRRLGLDPARPTVLITTGALGFGDVEEAVLALVGSGDRGDPPLQVVVVCGRNRELGARLAALGLPADQLRVLGWVDTMPDLLRAADVVVSNAGGATALEAMATGTPVVMYRPIAAHGAANAALMTACGLAETCRSPRALAACVRSLVRGGRPAAGARPVPLGPPDLGLRAVAHPQEAVPASTAPRGRSPAWPLRPQDAFFLYVQSSGVAQQVGVVLDLDPAPSGRPLRRADLLEVLRQRLPVMVTLRRQLVPAGRWRRPGWSVLPDVDPAAHVEERRLSRDADQAALDAVLDEFWSQPVALDAPPWRMMLVTGLPGGRTKLAVKLHHSLGDGLSVIGTLTRLLDPGPSHGPDPAASANASPPASPDRGEGRAAARTLAGLRRARTVTGALGRMALAGPAPRSRLNRPPATPRRHLVTTTLPMSDVNRAAGACGVHVSVLLCTLVAEALRATYPAEQTPERLRALFAVSRRPRHGRTHGNWTGAMTLDLPLGAMPVTVRARTIRDHLRRALTSGQPDAAALRGAMGALPVPLQAWFARRLYTSRFTNVMISYVPAPAPSHSLVAAPIRAAVPVIPLADGVPIGAGAMPWGDVLGIGVLLDASLAGIGERFVSAVHTAVDHILERDTQPADLPAPERPYPAVAVGAR